MGNPLVEYVSILVSILHVFEHEVSPLEKTKSIGNLASCEVARQNTIPVLHCDRAQLSDYVGKLFLFILLYVREYELLHMVIPDYLKIVHLGPIRLHDATHAILDLKHKIAEVACQGPTIEEH